MKHASMNISTAAKVIDLLGGAENLLDSGRPRKLPGWPRPEYTTMYGTTGNVDRHTDTLLVDKVSLPGALKLAQYELGYSDRIRLLAANLIVTHHYTNGGNHKGHPIQIRYDNIEDLDNDERDTRQIQRTLKYCRKDVERGFDRVKLSGIIQKNLIRQMVKQAGRATR